MRELAPGLRVDVARRIIELDGTVAIDVHRPGAGKIYLEVLVCSRGTREHEALVVTDVLASRVHAAALLIGLEPGSPGSWRFEGPRAIGTPPTGARVDVRVQSRTQGAGLAEGQGEPITGWVIDAARGVSLDGIDAKPDDSAGSRGAFVFAGSRFSQRDGNEWYAGDPEGTIVGLAAFGTETIAWTGMYHPDADRMTPTWIADASRVPPSGARVKVIIAPSSSVQE